MLDLTPFVHNWLLPALALIFAGLTGWLVLQTTGWLQAHAAFLNAESRNKIANIEQTALQKGADYVMRWLDREGGQLHPEVNSWLLRQGAQVALDHAAGTLADNGWSPEETANKILAKLPNAYVTTDINKAAAIPAHYDTVTVAPLPPIPTK